MKDWIVETRAVSRRVYHVQAENEKEAIALSCQTPPEHDEDEYEETMSVVESMASPPSSPVKDEATVSTSISKSTESKERS